MRKTKITTILAGILLGASLLTMTGCSKEEKELLEELGNSIEKIEDNANEENQAENNPDEQEILEGRKEQYKEAGFTDEQIEIMLMDEQTFFDFADENPDKVRDLNFYLTKCKDLLNIQVSSEYKEPLPEEVDWSKAPNFNEPLSQEFMDKLLNFDAKLYVKAKGYNKMSPEERKKFWEDFELESIRSQNEKIQEENQDLTRKTDEANAKEEKIKEISKKENIELITQKELEERVEEINKDVISIRKTLMDNYNNKTKTNKKDIEENLKRLCKNTKDLEGKTFLIIGTNPFKADSSLIACDVQFGGNRQEDSVTLREVNVNEYDKMLGDRDMHPSEVISQKDYDNELESSFDGFIKDCNDYLNDSSFAGYYFDSFNPDRKMLSDYELNTFLSEEK